MGGFVERWHQFRRSMSRRTPHTKTEENRVKIEDELGSNSATLPLEVLPLAEVDTTGFSRKKTLSWPRRMLRKSFRKYKKDWDDSSQAQNSLACVVASSCEGPSGTTSIDDADCPDKSLNANCQLNLVTNAIVRIGEDPVSDGTVRETAKPSTTAEQHESHSTDASNAGAAREVYLLSPTTPPLPVSYDDQSGSPASDRLGIQNVEIVPDLSNTQIDDEETLENLPSNYGSFVESLTDSEALNSTHNERTELGAPCNYSSMTSHGQGNGRESPCVQSVSSTEPKSSSEAQSLSPAFLYDGRMSCSSDDLGCDEIPKQNHKKLCRRFSNTSVRSNSSWLANIGPNFSRGWSYKENRRLRKLSNSSLTSWQRSVRRRPSRVQKLSVPIIMVNNQTDVKNQANISYLTASGNSSSLETQASRKLSSDDFSRKPGMNSSRFSSLRAYPSWIKNKEQTFVRGWSTKKSQKSQLTGSTASRLSVRKSLLRRNALKTHTPVQSDISRIVRKNSLAADAGKRVRQKPRRDGGTTSNTGTYGKDKRRKNSDHAGNKSKKIQNVSEASVRSEESSNSGETLKASWSSLSSCGDVITPSTCRCHSAQSSEDSQELAAPKGPNGPTTASGSKRAPALNSSGPPAPGSLNYWSAGAVDSSAASESGALPMQRPPCACAGGHDRRPHDARHHGHHLVRCDSTRQPESENGLVEDLSRAPIVLADHCVKMPGTQRSTRRSSEGCVAMGSEMSEMRDVNCESKQVSDRRSLLRYSASFNSKLLDRETDVSKFLNNIYDGEADGVRDGKPKPPPVDVSGGGGETEPLRTPPPAQQLTPRTPGGLSGRHDTLRDKERKIGHRRVGEGGQVTYKKIGTNQIMGSIQLGIHQAVGSLAGIPELDVLIQDFYVVETISFPPNGSETTPAHPYSDYRFKVYAPTAFRHFRDLFRIAPSDYLVSLCNEDLRELSNPGASGSIFYVTNDDEFIIKTVQHKEAEFLQKLLPGYYMNLNQNPRTLLPKFFGLYTYQCNAKNIRLVTMNNLLPSSVKMHQKYDLKGSTYKRKANKYERSKSSPTYKDLDFMEHHPEGILLEADTYKALMNTLERDCRVLASFKIMDYSLLVGIHNLDLAAREKQERANGRNGGKSGGGGSGGQGGSGSAGGGNASDDDSGAAGGGDDEGAEGAPGLSRSRSINRQRLVAHSTAMESIQADAADPIDEEDHVPPGGIPARNVKGERLLLFLGIIDILQSYRLKKKLEHTLKSMVTDGDTISVHRPNFYAQRFQKFMAERVFKRIPSRGSGRGSDSSTHGDSLGTTSPPAAAPHRSSLHHVRSSHHHVTTVAIQEDRTDVVRKGPKLRFKGLGEDDEDAHPGEQQSPDVPPVTLTRYTSNTISVSDVRLEARTDSRSTLSVDSSMASSGHGGHRTHTWTPPLSVEGSTPTWTEGTPSFTESSSSGDLGCPNTPNRSLNTTVDSAQHETEMKQLHHFGPRQHFTSKQDRRVVTTFVVSSSSSSYKPAPHFTTSSSPCHYTTIAAIPYNTKTSTHYNYVRSSSFAVPSPSATTARVPESGATTQVNGILSSGGGVVSTPAPSDSSGVTNGTRVPPGTFTVTVQVGDPLKPPIIPASVGVDEI